MINQRLSARTLVLSLLFLGFLATIEAQSLGNAGTVEGVVLDPTGSAIVKAEIVLRNPVTGYAQKASSGNDGAFRLVNIPPNTYHLEINAPGFEVFSQDLRIRNSVPVAVKATMTLAGAKTSVDVESAGADLLETDPSSHVDVDRNQILKMPAIDPGGGLSQAIIHSTGGVAADGNGFFHPLGDHAQVGFVIDGQPISDQQSKVFSTQLPTSAIQSMELTTGSPNAEFGDKSSLIAQVTTRSGLGSGKLFGNVESSYGSFGTVGGSVGLGFGTAKFGSFLAVDGVRTGRFLDTPEFTAFHDKGNSQTIFERLDYEPSGRDALHLNLFAARNWVQNPNSYDQLQQDQRQRVLTWNLAPGYQHTYGAKTVLTINPYVRKDQFNYYASRDPLADSPATQNQSRQLLNWGLKADAATIAGHHNLKYGIDTKQTRLLENFGFGVTDAAFNSPCLDASGSSVGNASLLSPAQCATAGYQPNTAFSPSLLRYDLTRGGGLFRFHNTDNINQFAVFVQDSYTRGNLNINVGLRVDHYAGLATRNGVEPRLGIAYHIKPTGTIVRAAYSRTFETPFNENLLLSSATGAGGLAENVFGSAAVPIQPGFRNQFNTGLQQAVGKYLRIDADYFWKFTHNAFDFGTLLNTTITFPIAWHNSKLDGVTGRVSTTNIKGFQAYWTFGHTRARYFFPETGGLIPQGSPLDGGVFRIDHDQAFQSNLNLRYQHKKDREWVAFTYRYDSGMVVSGVPDSAAALGLTPNQQVTIGLACGGVAATVAAPITSCSGLVTSKLMTLPQAGQGNDDHNPNRVNPRNILNLGIGTDNLLHRDGARRFTASVDIANLTNKVAIYNFLSTFSGTHFLQPRTVLVRFGFVF